MIGKTLGHYKVGAQLGRGGMGEVFLADDLSLGRKVALKFIPDLFAGDLERMARFEREAKLLAALNHPNIAAIYGFEQAEGKRFLVLELVEGETLADQIRSGPIPVEETLKIALQIADALEAAHEKGVIHRDLKPANIEITPEGKVKVLDFGLAKALADEVPGAALADSPTLSITEAMTRPGVILGTAAYMSPEQAKAKTVDRRTDIWSLGCILYECLTGRRAFGGETVTETLAAILKSEPEWQALPETTPPGIRVLLRRCLEKDRSRRFHDVGDVRIQIEEASGAPQAPGASVGARTGWRRAIILSVALMCLAVGGAVVWVMKPSRPLPVAHVKIGLQPAGLLGVRLNRSRPFRTEIAFSPDGSRIVYSARRLNAPSGQLYLRALDRAEAVSLAGTDGAVDPVLSPDGQWVAFWANGELRKVPVVGGPPVTICKIPDLPPCGASWGSADAIVFSRMNGGLWLVSANGGEPRQLTVLDTVHGEWSHRLPYVLPGGDAVLFTVTKDQFPNWAETDIAVQSIGSGQRKTIIRGGADARYVPSGHVVYVRRGVLMAAAFDLGRLEITGSAAGVVEDVMQAADSTAPPVESGAAQFSISATGALAYVPGGVFPAVSDSLVSVDRRGTVQRLPVPEGAYLAPRIAPDGRRVAFLHLTGSIHRVWIHDLVRGTSSRLTMDHSAFPVWSPDGARIAYENHNLFWQSADGSAAAERLTTSDQRQIPAAWSPNGKELIFVQGDPAERYGIWALPLEGDRRPRPLVQGPANEGWPDISPDGRWLAYASDESGRREVYVRPYGGSAGKQQVSINGGASPAWSRSGRELFFLAPGDNSVPDAMVAVEMTTGTVLKVGPPRVLFKGPFSTTITKSFDVTPDGQRFVLVQAAERPPAPPVTEINLILNWGEELRRLAK